MSNTRLEQLLSFLEGSPKDAFIHFAIAKEYENLDNLDKALSYYQHLEQNNPDYVGTYYHLGKLYEKQEKINEAFSTYKKGMSIAKKLGDQHALSELAGAKLALGDDEDFEEV